jgi:acetyltransferase-like isoleucine patch superfamily enzyme
LSVRLGAALGAVVRSYVERMKTEIHLLQLTAHFPGMLMARPNYWRFDTLAAIEIHGRAIVGPYCEIVVFQRSPRSAVPGRLVLREGSVISAGCNLRAAGGTIEIGRHSGLGPGTVAVAANHTMPEDTPFLTAPWDETRTGVVLGDNVWVGAGCVLLPGTTIGDNAMVAAGSVVSRSVPAGEIWGGVPARYIKKVRDGS